MLKGLWQKTAKLTLSGLALVLLLTGGARADDKDLRELRERMEKLEYQNDELRRRLDQGPAAMPSALQPVGAEEEQQKADDKKAADKKGPEAEPWIEVGKNLGLKGVWTGYQPWWETEDKSFRIHVGGRTQFDVIWARSTDRVQFGRGGVGNLGDAVNFRRARLEIDGWMYETFDFFCEYDFMNTANVDPALPANEANVINVPAPTDLWGGLNHLPLFGTVRMGNMKPPISLEHLTSSRYLDFIERSPQFDPYFNRNNGFEPGLMMANWTENERLTWAVGVFKNNNSIFGWNVSDGDAQFNARVTALPYFRDEGRCMVHLGFGVQYDAPDNGVAQLRERWLLRNGGTSLHNTVAQAFVRGENQVILVPELFVNLGPLSFQAEFIANSLNHVTGFQTQSQGVVALGNDTTTYFSHAFYIQALYFLTGEHRPYGRTYLHSSGAAPTRVVPFRNFFWLPGHGCPNPFSSGAWQVGARYGYSDLSNHGIFGGQINEVTLGLNWFLNPNVKLQWNYDIGYRGQLGPLSSSNGTFQGFATRLAFDF